jgi:hypothetical protein
MARYWVWLGQENPDGDKRKKRFEKELEKLSNRVSENGSERYSYVTEDLEEAKEVAKHACMHANHIYTLQQNTIENYLLNPKAITRAFPQKAWSEKEIEDFFEKTKNKKIRK